MKNQVFKDVVPRDIIETFIKKLCIVENNKYVFNRYCFKKGIIENTIGEFFETIKNYYHKSKQYYVERYKTTTSVATVIRQLCKLHNIQVISKLKYYNSTYENVYYITIETKPNHSTNEEK
jgi:hypothetical protein